MSDRLVQTIDLPATLLDYFGVVRPETMEGIPLAETLATDAPPRTGALFGLYGAHVNVTDGRYVYMRAPVAGNTPLAEYTLTPTRIHHFLGSDGFTAAEMVGPLSPGPTATVSCASRAAHGHRGAYEGSDVAPDA